MRFEPRLNRARGAGEVEMTSDDGWQQAYSALVERGDQRPLAEKFGGAVPVPLWLREHMARMLDPATDPKQADRLVFSRSRALARKMQANQDRLAIGVEFLELSTGRPREEVLAELSKHYNVSQSYIKRGASMARKLPPSFRNRARQLPPVWGSDASQKRRAPNEPR
jgi:hypothetical protein